MKNEDLYHYAEEDLQQFDYGEYVQEEFNQMFNEWEYIFSQQHNTEIHKPFFKHNS